jgi:hypothetical protein
MKRAVRRMNIGCGITLNIMPHKGAQSQSLKQTLRGFQRFRVYIE